MKKLLSVFVGFMLCVTLVGCGGESHEAEIKASVDGYMSAVKEGNYTRALEFTVGADKLKDNFGLSRIQEEYKNFFSEEEVSESANKAAQDFANYLMTKSITEYTIDKITENDNEATVELSGKCIDFEQMNVETGKVDTDQLVQEYLEKNLSEYSQLMTEKGEEAVMQKVMEDVTPVLFDAMKKAVDSTPSRDFKMQMTITNTDGKWLISTIDELQI